MERVVDERDATKPEGSYTARLLAKGLDGALKKLGEEATEVVLAAKGETDEGWRKSPPTYCSTSSWRSTSEVCRSPVWPKC